MAPPNSIVVPSTARKSARPGLLVPATPAHTVTERKRPRIQHTDENNDDDENHLISHCRILESPQPVARPVRPRPVSYDMPSPVAASSLVAEALTALAEQKARRERRKTAMLQQQQRARNEVRY